MTLDEFRNYLTEMLERANRTQSADSLDIIAGQMWRRFIPYAISLYTLEGVLQQIVETFPSASEDDDEEADTD